MVTEPPESEFDAGVRWPDRRRGRGRGRPTRGRPPTMQCDSFCQMRARTFYDPLVTVDDELDRAAVPRREHQPNEDSTEFTIKIREGITFHDGTPLNADAVMDNINRNFTSLLIGAAVKDIARDVADPVPIPTTRRSSSRRSTTSRSRSSPASTATPPSRSHGRLFPTYLTGLRPAWSPHRHGSPRSTPARPADRRRRHRPVHDLQSYAPGDKTGRHQEPRLLDGPTRTATSCRTSTRSSSG